MLLMCEQSLWVAALINAASLDWPETALTSTRCFSFIGMQNALGFGYNNRSLANPLSSAFETGILASWPSACFLAWMAGFIQLHVIH